MSKPIPDKAEVALEYPDKLYIGTFEQSARFEAHLDEKGISLTLERPGDAEVRKAIHMQLNYALFAEILCDVARTVSATLPDGGPHRDALRDAANALCRSLDPLSVAANREAEKEACREQGQDDKDDISRMTPRDEVLLLHIME